jgi:hypothetical protein
VKILSVNFDFKIENFGSTFDSSSLNFDWYCMGNPKKWCQNDLPTSQIPGHEDFASNADTTKSRLSVARIYV